MIATIVEEAPKLSTTHTWVLVETYNSVDGPRQRISGRFPSRDHLIRHLRQMGEMEAFA